MEQVLLAKPVVTQIISMIRCDDNDRIVDLATELARFPLSRFAQLPRALLRLLLALLPNTIG